MSPGAARPDLVAAPQQTGSIAFASDSEGDFDLYVASVKGGRATPLAPHPAQDTGPAWSPDGQRLAFASTRFGTWDIFILDLRDDSVRPLTRGRGSEFDPAWSGDGRFIAYESNATGNWEVFYVRVAGPLKPVNVSRSAAANDFDPAWVGGRPELVWESDRSGNFDLYWAPIAGAPRALLPTRDPEFHPAVSPDGTRLAFERRDGKGNYDVYVVPIANGKVGGAPTRLTRNLAEEAEPSWSPDGRHIAIVVSSAAGYFVRTIESTAGRPTSTVSNSTDGDDIAPAWRAAGAPASVRQPAAIAQAGCVIVGTTSGETLNGDGFGNVICGGEGNDVLNGNGGADELYGDPGADAMFGNTGGDKIYGGANYGGIGRDRERGGDQDDRLYGRGDGVKDCIWGDNGTNDWARLDGGLDNVSPPPVPWGPPPPWSDTICGNNATIEAFD